MHSQHFCEHISSHINNLTIFNNQKIFLFEKKIQYKMDLHMIYQYSQQVNTSISNKGNLIENFIYSL